MFENICLIGEMRDFLREIIYLAFEIKCYSRILLE